MTTLLAWGAADDHGLTAVYIATDSRISWGKTQKWDYGRKVFSSKKYPDILGYCGEVLFTTQVLSQIMDLIDSCLIYNIGDNPDVKSEKIYNLIKKSFSDYPREYMLPSITIIYCTMDENKQYKFFEITWDNKRWNKIEKELEKKSSKIEVYGSGRENFNELLSIAENKDKSRDLFYYFCESISNGGDPLSGGAPQLVGIYRNGTANSFGMIINGKRYLNGMDLDEIGTNLNLIEWRNNLFEVCDGNTMKIKPKAQRQPRL